MPQATPIILADGKATPVQHTFEPTKIGDLSANYVGPGISLAGRETLIIDRREASASVAGRANYTIRKPTEQVVDGVTRVSHQSQLTVTAISAPASTEAERADLWAMGKSLFSDVTARDVFVKGAGLF